MSCATIANWMVLPSPTWSARTKAGLLVGSDVGVEGHLDERLLMLPEAGLLAVNRATR